MANLYLKSGGGNWSAAATWSATSAAGIDNAGPPAATTDAIMELASGNVTIDSGAVCRSLDTTSGVGSYGGVITHNAITFNIGDGTAGAGNVALKLNSGLTYTLVNAKTSAITFKSTSATQQTITTGTRTLGNIVINGAGSSYQTTDNITSSGSFTYTAGTTFDTTTNSNTITLNGSAITFAGAAKTYYGAALTGSGTATVTGANTFTNLNRTGTAANTEILQLNASQTVTGILTLAGNSRVNQLFVQSQTLGTPLTITNSGATMTVSNTDFMDISLGTVWNASARTDIGDAGGNTNITFPASVTQTHTTSTGGNWSDVTKWTSRIPLPQDDVVVNVNTTGVLTIDQPRSGRDVTFTGFTGDITTNNNSWYGNIILASGMTGGGTQGTITLRGRGSQTFASNTYVTKFGVSVASFGGTYTFSDSYSGNAGQSISIVTGTVVLSATSSAGSISTSGALPQVLTITNQTINLIATNAMSVWSMGASLTLNSSGSTIVFNSTSASTRTFSGGGKTYGTLTYTIAGSTGQMTVTGANIFDILNFSDATNARTLVLPASTTTTILTTFNVNGTSGKLMTINSSSAGTTATLSKANGLVSCDYLSLKDSTATGGANWYAGANSTQGTNVVGWTFTAPPTATGGTALLLGV